MRWLARGLGAVFAVGMLLVLVVPVVLPERRVVTWVVSALTESLRAPVEIEGLEFHPLWGVSVDRITVGPPAGFTQDVLQATGVRFRYALAGALRSRLVVQNMAVESLAVTLEETARGLNVGVLGGPETSSGETDEPFVPVRGPFLPLDVVVEDLSIGPTALAYRTESGSLVVEGIRGFGRAALGAETSDVTLAISVAPGPTANVRARRSPAGPETRGRWSLDLRVQGEADTGDRPMLRSLRFDGRTALEGVHLAAGGDSVPSLAAALRAEVRGEQDVLTLGPVSVDPRRGSRSPRAGGGPRASGRRGSLGGPGTRPDRGRSAGPAADRGLRRGSPRPSDRRARPHAGGAPPRSPATGASRRGETRPSGGASRSVVGAPPRALHRGDGSSRRRRSVLCR